ncbi:MAG: hypothetical protein GKC07_08775 [Methanomicrobiales archaeon]|nr:hypothetical protein [Methanomicrobiales archaeon]
MDRRDRAILLVSILLIILVGALAVVLPVLPFHRAQEILERPAGTIELPVTTEAALLSPEITTVPEPPLIQGPPAFRLLVTPVEARARPGDTILYSMTIEPEGGFDDPVSLRLDVRALFLYQESFNLGRIDPPFPRTAEYRFVVPRDVPSGITVSGVLTGEGGDYRDTVSLILIIT